MRYLPDLRWVLFALLIYLAILVGTFPADRAYAHWKASALAQPGVQMAGLSGSLWAGKAATALINGRPVHDLEWRLEPLALLTGQVGLAWRASLPQPDDQPAYAEGDARFGLDGSVDLRRFEARLPAMTIAALVNAQPVRPSGLVSINLDALQWNGRSLEAADGRIVWNGAGINLFQPVVLGDLVLTLETTDSGVRGVVADNGGPLAIEGLVTLDAEGNYDLVADLSARQGLQGSKELEAALATIRRPGPDGKVQVKQRGNLADVGLAPRPPR